MSSNKFSRNLILNFMITVCFTLAILVAPLFAQSTPRGTFDSDEESREMEDGTSSCTTDFQEYKPKVGYCYDLSHITTITCDGADESYFGASVEAIKACNELTNVMLMLIALLDTEGEWEKVCIDFCANKQPDPDIHCEMDYTDFPQGECENESGYNCGWQDREFSTAICTADNYFEKYCKCKPAAYEGTDPDIS